MRLHGRNAAQWWRHEKSEDRYNGFLYSANELKEFSAIAGAAKTLVKSRISTRTTTSHPVGGQRGDVEGAVGEPIEGDNSPSWSSAIQNWRICDYFAAPFTVARLITSFTLN